MPNQDENMSLLLWLADWNTAECNSSNNVPGPLTGWSENISPLKTKQNNLRKMSTIYKSKMSKIMNLPAHISQLEQCRKSWPTFFLSPCHPLSHHPLCPLILKQIPDAVSRGHFLNRLSLMSESLFHLSGIWG